VAASTETDERTDTNMTTTLARPLSTGFLDPPTPVRWHRPLLVLAAGMTVLAGFALVARFVSTVEVTGLNQWDKPLKFALSTVIYAVSWSWLIGQLEHGRRAGRAAGTVITVALYVELALITWAAATGTTSHFNVSTPLNTAVWSVMAVSISVLWGANLVAAVMLFRTRIEDRARAIAIRAGAVLSLVGLGLGYLMTSPTAQQLSSFQGIAGAHTVGLADGGPGLPVLGWSTVGGDLRIPHFVGMHALQLVPLALVLLELASRRVMVLRDVQVRAGLVRTVAAGYAGLVALVTWQALRGQSIVRPDGATTVAGAALAAAVLVACAAVVVRGRARRTSEVAR
jgi:hypothetical protein